MRLFLLLLMIFSTAHAQETGMTLGQIQEVVTQTLDKQRFSKLQLRGYAQFRYNRLGETNPELTCPQCDRSIGDKNGFFYRRGRLILFGELNDRVFVYVQPDYASEIGGTQNVFNIRDAYFDYALEETKEFRLRFGISKVPFGFENLQSSSNRAPLDRNDALNSAVPNERDIGLYFMYAPTEVRKRYQELTNAFLKGSGDYGMLAVGLMNGQTLNRPERNNDLHRVVRLSYPFKLANGQFIEASLQGYDGQFFAQPLTGNAYQNVAGLNENFRDQRAAASLIVYPQPLGFQMEYNIGHGPEFDPTLNRVTGQSLRGGYAQVNYNWQRGNERYFPFVRYQSYDGGKKMEGGRAYRVREWEIGTEWQPVPSFELTAAYAISDRLTQANATDRSQQSGNLIRLQAQFNY
jgi:hypothetical protein